MANRFDQAMKLMRKHAPQTKEDGFHNLLPLAGRHVEELIAAFRVEQEHGLRCWLLELIGEARSPLAFDTLAGQLYGEDEALRRWAVRGLEMLDTKAARTELWRARTNGVVPGPSIEGAAR